MSFFIFNILMFFKLMIRACPFRPCFRHLLFICPTEQIKELKQCLNHSRGIFCISKCEIQTKY